MDKLTAMKVFLRVAEMASFTKASESLGLPKASISTYVQQLVSLLGTRLFHRTTRRVQLTQDGQSFYERCVDLLSDVDEVESKVGSEERGKEKLNRLLVEVLSE